MLPRSTSPCCSRREAEKVAGEQVKVTQGQLRRATQLVEAGASPANELLQVEAQLARDEQRLLTAQNQTTLSYLALAQSMGVPLGSFTLAEVKDSEFNGKPTVISLRPEAIYSASVADQPSIKAASARMESAALGIKVAQARRLPRLSVNGQLGTSYSDLARKVTGSSSVMCPLGTGTMAVPKSARLHGVFSSHYGGYVLLGSSL